VEKKMVQSDKEGRWLPTKVFPCDCGMEGAVVSVEEDEDFCDCKDAPYINLAFWEFGTKLEKNKGLSYWRRIKYACRILRGGSLWTDMVSMNCSTAKNFANHIFYLISKAKRKDGTKPLVDWPKNEKVREDKVK
jgi:hypothetical protein